MKLYSLLLIALFSLALAGCQEKTAPEDTPPEEVSDTTDETLTPEETVKNDEENTDCAVDEVPKGKWCYNIEELFSFLLPEEFEIYGEIDEGNFISKKNQFIHIGYFPLTAFDEKAQSLLKEGKIQEYMEYEQENTCPPEVDCKAKLDPETLSYTNLGENRFLKYDVVLKEGDTTFISKHYSTVLNEVFIDFSSPEDEMVPNPPNSETMVKAVKIDEKVFEEMMTTLTPKKK